MALLFEEKLEEEGEEGLEDGGGVSRSSLSVPMSEEVPAEGLLA